MAQLIWPNPPTTVIADTFHCAIVASELSKVGVESGMSDPRNVAHDKKVKQEKAHEGASGAGTRKKRAPKTEAATAELAPKPEATLEKASVEQAPGEYEKSQAVLSKLKEMEFHSRANIETLAQLTLTIEDELKQKEFSVPIGDVYSAQDGFHTKIAELIQNYEMKIGTLRPSA